MFAGLLGLECHNNSARRQYEATEGGRPAGTSSRKRPHRRPGYMRGEASRQQGTTAGDQEEDGEENSIGLRDCGLNRDIADRADAQSKSHVSAAAVSCHRQKCNSSFRSLVRPPPAASPHGVASPPKRQGHCASPRTERRSRPPPPDETPASDAFSSSFSFIQQSLTSSHRTGINSDTPAQGAEPLQQPVEKHPLRSPAPFLLEQPVPKLLSTPPSQSEREELPPSGRLWRECVWASREATAELPDCDSRSLDTELTSSLSVDSDTASASSVTSGYESATPSSEQGWDNLMKKYDGVLQDCLQNNRTNTKIESMMLKLRRLQQKAILDDDYDAAERFGKKLEELCVERADLKLGLPSRQPSVALFLERLKQVVHSALQRSDCGPRREGLELGPGDRLESSSGGPLHQRNRLVQERQVVEEEIAELQQRLMELKDRSRCLEQQIQREEQHVEMEELEGSVLKSCSAAQLRDVSRALQDLVTSESRMQICVSTPPSMLRLQEQEQSLNLSIKEATAKVVMSQRLGSSLRRKVSETETQLLALHEAKLAAISGNDFSSAKELKAEMKAVCVERDRLEALAKRLHSLSSGNSQELARMKEQRQQLRQELEHREALHESRLKEHASKYVELLEDRLHSCSCPGLERIWEADLEACQLFLRGLQMRTPGCGGTEVEDLPTEADFNLTQHLGATKEEEDCAMLTALGGRWCPEANLQHSEFTKKLEEFLFGMEENQAEDECSEAEAADLTERCEAIGDRLMTLEDELQTAILNRDQALTLSLEKEVQEVKAALQGMLVQLREEAEEEEDGKESREGRIMESGTDEEEEEEKEEEEDEEDQYFSDSWDI